MSVLLDLKDNASAEQTPDGFQITRVAFVDELSGTAERRIYDALRTPGLPRLGDAHPANANLRLLNASAKTEGATQAIVTLNYRQPTPDDLVKLSTDGGIVSIEIDSSTSSEHTSLDAAGNLMFNHFGGYVQFLNPNTGQPQFATGYYDINDLVKADILRPQLSVRIIREHIDIPKAIAKKYIGTVNADQWSGDPPLTWLCNRINSALQPNRRWRTTYEFFYRPLTWQLKDAVEIFGQVPINAVIGNGIKYFDIYGSISWSQIGVSW